MSSFDEYKQLTGSETVKVIPYDIALSIVVDHARMLKRAKGMKDFCEKHDINYISFSTLVSKKSNIQMPHLVTQVLEILGFQPMEKKETIYYVNQLPMNYM